MDSRDRIEYVQNDDGEWFWRHLDRNGEQLARSSETYARKDDMLRASERTLGPERLRGMEVKTLPKASRDAAAVRGEEPVGDDGEPTPADLFDTTVNAPDSPEGDSGAPSGE